MCQTDQFRKSDQRRCVPRYNLSKCQTDLCVEKSPEECRKSDKRWCVPRDDPDKSVSLSLTDTDQSVPLTEPSGTMPDLSVEKPPEESVPKNEMPALSDETAMSAPTPPPQHPSQNMCSLT